jgi:hypothetical protein
LRELEIKQKARWNLRGARVFSRPVEKIMRTDGETLRPLGREPKHFSSLVGVVVIAREVTYGNSVAIPAIAETKNRRRYGKASWPQDSNQSTHFICIAFNR